MVFLQHHGQAQTIDAPSLDTKPEALPATPFTFPKYDEFTLDNGLHVFVVEDHSLPRITFSLAMKCGDAYDPAKKEGTATIAADMMMKGTKDMDAAAYANKLDGVGASISTTSAGEQTNISGAALKKHSNLLFQMLGDMLTASTYPAEEFEKLRQQYIANVVSEQARPGTVAAALSRKVIYGFDHPLARAQSKASLTALTLDDVKAFHNAWHKPNISSIAVVGDVTKAEAKKLLEKYLKGWSKQTTPDVTIPAMTTAKAGVYFIARPGSVQSSVIVCAAAPSITADDWNAVDVTMGYIGSGFGSRLFSTLRETYSYTYSPFGYVTRGARYNRVSTGADVRTSVTDSALTVILREISNVGQTGPDPVALKARIAYEAGQYRLSYEKAANVASMLQLSWTCSMPVSWAAEWTDRIEDVGFGQVVAAAQKYLDMFKLRTVVVGDPSIVDKLAAFGPVFHYDLDYQPLVAEKLQDADIDVGGLLEQYRKAIGGADQIAKINTVVMSGKAVMSMQGQPFKGTITRKVMMPNKEVTELDLGMMKQQQWTDGASAWVAMNGGEAAEADVEETTRIKQEARLFPVLHWSDDNCKATVAGRRGNMIVVNVVNANGRTQRYMFDVESYLLVQTEKDEQTPQGPITVIEKLSDYKAVDGVKFPMMVKVETPLYNLEYTYTVQINTGVQATDFTPELK